jgi:hypothetical protein
VKRFARWLRTWRLLPLVLGLLVCLPSCSSGMTPAQTAAQVRSEARMAYSVGAVALTKAQEAYVIWANSLKAPTQAQADADLKIVAGLHATHDALEVVKAWLETGQGEPAAKQKLREAIDGLVLLSDLLAKQGQVLPPELVTGLETARLVLGGAQ